MIIWAFCTTSANLWRSIPGQCALSKMMTFATRRDLLAGLSDGRWVVLCSMSSDMKDPGNWEGCWVVKGEWKGEEGPSVWRRETGCIVTAEPRRQRWPSGDSTVCSGGRRHHHPIDFPSQHQNVSFSEDKRWSFFVTPYFKMPDRVFIFWYRMMVQTQIHECQRLMTRMRPAADNSTIWVRLLWWQWVLTFEANVHHWMRIFFSL